MTKLLQTEPKSVAFVPRCQPNGLRLLQILYQLVDLAERTDTTALIIIKNSHCIVERYFGSDDLVHLMSITKSIVSLAIGMLLNKHTSVNINTPLSVWYPEWSQDIKSSVTLGHILTHTSGIRDAGDPFFKSENSLEFSRKSDIVGLPGGCFSYSNQAVQLLSGVVSALVECPIDQYVADHLFAPLGIKEWIWQKDDAGNVLVYSGLQLRGADLAKIGYMMLNRGFYNGRQILPQRWVLESTAPGSPVAPFYGFLWFLRYNLELNTVWQQGLFYADGWLGQQLIIIPCGALVAVRLHKRCSGGGEEENTHCRFAEFLNLCEELGYHESKGIIP